MRNLYEQCLKLTQFAALEFEEIFQFSQERLKQALETELIENGYAVQKQSGFLYAQGTVPVLLVAQLMDLLVGHVNLFAGFKIDAVDDAVRVDVFAVGVGADEDFTALEIPGKLPRCFVCCARVDVCTFWKTLYHVVEHHAAVFVVQQLCT